jgi:hypothetical protein
MLCVSAPLPASIASVAKSGLREARVQGVPASPNT